ncbi:hypothetical protein NQ318_023362 [Aromia moschata]|uniref:DDE-1 domain-containing protein n=1 Tax=Aromia moschata TaxID=1265417 RepID=A0AAV8XA86_9CUCU|nr:hypothetical protein NQ318_023362 [Aromia moschata]
MDPFIMYDYFDILKETINHLNLHNTPERIWNLDESSLCIDLRKTKVVGAVNKPSSRTISTPAFLMCNAAGGKPPPLIVYKGVNVWDQRMAHEGKGYPGTVYAATKNGWMETEVFTNYFLKTILRTIGEQRPVLITQTSVTYDGHSTHISLALIERAIQENITILKLPPHTSHLLQPLDLAVFKPFKTKWDFHGIGSM